MGTCNSRLLPAALAAAAEQRLSEFKSQGIANTTWAFAPVNYLDGKLFAPWTVAAELRLCGFNPHSVANMAWALATVNCLVERHLFLGFTLTTAAVSWPASDASALLPPWGGSFGHDAPLGRAAVCSRSDSVHISSHRREWGSEAFVFAFASA